MPWKKVNLKRWASEMGVDLYEIDQKLKLREKIVALRKELGWTQEELARRANISRSRVAQIETGVRLHKMSFDILFRVLQALGCQYRISAKRAA